MRIAISTIQSLNYGNRLQNYALQEVLRQDGHQVESLQKERPSLVRAARRGARKFLKDDCVTRFRMFDSRYVAHARCAVCRDYCTSGMADAYDKFVIGSDQVWNPTFPFNSDAEYLPSVPGSKKIAYAASFGVTDLGDRETAIAALLKEIPFISMRERAGAELASHLTGRPVPVVLDPTMLLSPQEWSAVARKPEAFEDSRPYVFKYVLGEDANDSRIARIAAELGADIVDVADPGVKAGPAEFVWLATNSAAVCTDSFHASVFALLCHKPLGIFERVDSEADMSSRFDTLCELFAVQRCRANHGSFDMFSMGWDKFEDRLSGLRAQSLDWLRTALAGGGARA